MWAREDWRTEHRDREHGVPKSWQDSAVSRVLKVE